MTSLQLDILNHYYACADDYAFENNTARLQQVSDMEVWGLLELGDIDDNNKYGITDRGRFFIEYILKLPLPETTFIIKEIE